MVKRRIGAWGAVPLSILTDSSVKPNMFKVYVALSAYQGTNGKCWPSREEISTTTGLSVQSVSDAISALVESGWVERTRRPQSHKTNLYHVLHDVEEIRMSGKPGYPENTDSECPENPDFPLLMKTSNENTIGVPSEQAVKKESNTDEDAAISYLNEKAEVKFRFTESNRKLIRARYKEGFTIEDAKQVIDCKVKAWRESDMAKYLRPVTLFGNKFESYLMEAKKSAPTPSKKMEVDDDSREYYESFGIRV